MTTATKLTGRTDVQAEYVIAFNEGREGYFKRKSNVDNPYTGRDLDGLEEAWNEGYFDAFDTATEARENGIGYDF